MLGRVPAQAPLIGTWYFAPIPQAEPTFGKPLIPFGKPLIRS